MAENNTSHDRYAEAADRQIAKVGELRDAYGQLRDEQLAALDKELEAEDRNQDAREQAAEARRGEAVALEHHAKLLSSLGVAQAEIVELQRQAARLRVQAAKLDGDSAKEAVEMRRLELAIAQEAASQQTIKADARKREAETLEHQARVLQAQGGDQRRITELLQRATRERIEAARISGNEADALRLARKQELDMVRAITAERQRGAATGGGAGGMGGRMGGVGNILKVGARLSGVGMGISMVIDGAQQAAQVVDELSTTMLRNEKIAKGMEIGITGARAAFKGIIPDVELAAKANEAYSLGAVKNSQEFTALAAGISVLAAKQGKDVTQMLDSGVSAVARQSPLLLDNLGITLSNAEAQEIYAKSLGKTSKELSAQEKQVAFTQAALIKISAAAKEAAETDAKAAEVYKQTQTAFANLKDRALGFADSTGRAREAVRNLTDEQLRLLENSQFRGADAQDLNEALGEQAELQAKQTNEILGTNVSAEMFRATLSDIQELGKISDIVEKERARRRRGEIDAQALADKQAHEEKIAGLLAEADEADHYAKVIAASGFEQDAVNANIREAIRLRMEAALLAGDETKQLQLQRELELQDAKEQAKKARRGQGGSSAAENIRAEGEARIQAAEAELKLLELRSKLAGNAADTEYETARRTYEIELDRLDVEQRALEATRAKTKAERITSEARLGQIATEREILLTEKQLADRAREAELIKQAADETQARADAERELARREQERQARVIQLDDYRYKKAEQDIQHRGELEQAQARNDMGRLLAVHAMDRDLHENRMQQMRREHEARKRELDARQAAAEVMPVGTDAERLARQDELDSIVHDRKLERLEREMELRRAMQAEQVAMEQRQQELQQVQLARLGDAIGAFEQFQAQITDLAGFFRERSQAEADAELQRDVANLTAKGKAQKDALDRDIAAAKGNVALQNKLRKQQAQQEAANQRAIEAAQRKHHERKERQEMRSQGIQLMIIAAIETVKAIAAFASFNYLEGALHVAAAAVAGVKGGMLLAGKVPGAEGGAGTGAAAGGGDVSAGQRETIDPSNVPGSTPGQAAARESASPRTVDNGSSGGTVIQIGSINANGAIDDDFAENMARKLDDVGRAREF